MGLGVGNERLFSQNNQMMMKQQQQQAMNPRKIIVKRSRHIRDLSQDYNGSGPSPNGGGGSGISLPPMIKTPKESRGMMGERGNSFMMHT